MVFDREGAFLDGWGERSEAYFTVPHGLTVADGHVYTADVGDHTVRKWTREGKLLLTIGRPYIPSTAYGGQPLNRPTKVSVASNGDLFVSDGYGNAHVHVFDSSGAWQRSWGGRGGGPGEFDLPHGILVDRTDGDTVYVADRFNCRVQIFDAGGTVKGEWTGLALPNSVAKLPDGTFAVPELHGRVTILDRDGRAAARFGDEDAQRDDSEVAATALPGASARQHRGRVRSEPGAGRFCAPHGVAVDSRGAIYVAEVSESWVGLDRGDRAIQKFVPA